MNHRSPLGQQEEANWQKLLYRVHESYVSCQKVLRGRKASHLSSEDLSWKKICETPFKAELGAIHGVMHTQPHGHPLYTPETALHAPRAPHSFVLHTSRFARSSSVTNGRSTGVPSP